MLIIIKIIFIIVISYSNCLDKFIVLLVEYYINYTIIISITQKLTYVQRI